MSRVLAAWLLPLAALLFAGAEEVTIKVHPQGAALRDTWPMTVGASGCELGQLGASTEADENDPQWIADGVAGSALRFSGKSFVVHPSVGRAAYRLGGLEELTAEAWVRPRERTAGAAVLSVVDSFSLNVGSRDVSVIVRTPTDQTSFVRKIPLADGKWHHVALSCDGRTVRLFVDGKCVAKNTKLSERLRFNDSKGVLLVGAPDRGKAGYAGDVDEVRISHWCRYRGDFAPAF